jgi:hypothetical protein
VVAETGNKSRSTASRCARTPRGTSRRHRLEMNLWANTDKGICRRHLPSECFQLSHWDGEKGVYHINAVDTLTQWQVIGCAAKISEQYLIPVLEAMLHQFPFRIQGFHSDNGSEFINHTVPKLLENCWWSSPNRGLTEARTMRWWKARTAW